MAQWGKALTVKIRGLAQIPSTTEKPGKTIVPIIPALGVETRIPGD